MATGTRSKNLPANVREVHEYCDARRNRGWIRDGHFNRGINAAKRAGRQDDKAARSIIVASKSPDARVSAITCAARAIAKHHRADAARKRFDPQAAKAMSTADAEAFGVEAAHAMLRFGRAYRVMQHALERLPRADQLLANDIARKALGPGVQFVPWVADAREAA